MKASEHRALIVGLGSAGRRHLRHLQALGVRDFVLCRTGRSTLGPVREVDEATPVVSGIERALELGPTLAVIATPTALHLDSALAAAEAGCHLLIEKPVSHTPDRLDVLAQRAEQKGLTVAIGNQFRFHPLLNELATGLDAQRIGTVASARAVYREYLPDWHPWEDYRGSYAASEELGGGAIRTLIHAPDWLWWVFGPFRSVAAAVAKSGALETSVPDDAATITATTEAGVLAVAELDLTSRPAEVSLAVFGDQGCAELDFLGGHLYWTDPDGGAAIRRVPRGFGRDDLFALLMQDFLECIETGRTPRTSVDDGAAVLRALLGARDVALAGAYAEESA